jgi:Protein of unknown function (DUF4239)
MEYLANTVYGFSDTAIILSVCLLYVLSGVMIYGVLHLIFPTAQKTPDSYWGSTILGTVLSVNAMLLIFTLIQCVNALHTISDVVGAEVAALHRLEKAVSDVNLPWANTVQNAIKTYVGAVINTEWREMGTSQKNQATEKTFDQLIIDTFEFSHRLKKENLPAEIITQPLFDLMDARHGRLLKKNASLPLFYFEAIFLLEIVLIGKHYLNAGRGMRAALNLVFHLVILGTLLGLVVVYDHPFMGDSAIKDQGFRDFLSTVP